MKTAIVLMMCLSLTCCTPLPIPLKLQASRALNLDGQQRPLPVVVRFYQLQDADRFNQISFKQLWHNDRQILAESLLARKEVTLAPGQQVNIAIHRKPQAQYLGVTALFRQPDDEHWRVVKKIKPPFAYILQPIHLKFVGHRIKVMA